MKKHLIIIGICLIFLSACGNNVNSKPELTTKPTISNFINDKELYNKTIEKTENKEQSSSKTDIGQTDNKVTSIIEKFAPLYFFDGYHFISAENFVGFEDLIKLLKNISDENAFAKEFVNKANNVKYNELDKNSKLIFDNYLKFLFQIRDNEVFSYSLGGIKKIWYGYCKDLDYTHFYIQFKNYHKSYLCINRTKKHNPETVRSYITNTKKDKKNIVHLSEKISFKVKDMGNELNELNKFIKKNEEFINYIIDYRDNFYAPIINERLWKEKKEKELEKKAKEKSIPQIGMTQTEVKESKWGTPDHINKDTYSWGTTEQWVYNAYGYVYFKNGIVTSVSER